MKYSQYDQAGCLSDLCCMKKRLGAWKTRSPWIEASLLYCVDKASRTPVSYGEPAERLAGYRLIYWLIVEDDASGRYVVVR